MIFSIKQGILGVEGEISKYRENGYFCNKTGFMGVFEDAEFISDSDFIIHSSTRGCKIRVGGEISNIEKMLIFAIKLDLWGVLRMHFTTPC